VHSPSSPPSHDFLSTRPQLLGSGYFASIFFPKFSHTSATVDPGPIRTFQTVNASTRDSTRMYSINKNFKMLQDDVKFPNAWICDMQYLHWHTPRYTQSPLAWQSSSKLESAYSHSAPRTSFATDPAYAPAHYDPSRMSKNRACLSDSSGLLHTPHAIRPTRYTLDRLWELVPPQNSGQRSYGAQKSYFFWFLPFLESWYALWPGFRGGTSPHHCLLKILAKDRMARKKAILVSTFLRKLVRTLAWISRRHKLS
jgi:hypothetical protein